MWLSLTEPTDPPWRAARISGRSPWFSSVDSSGSGHITVDGVEAVHVYIENSGSGGIDAFGTTDSVSLDSSGSGGIDAMDLHAIDGDVDSSGSGDVRLFATGHVTIDLSGSGNVVVGGGASKDVDDSGSGEVIER